MNFRFLAGIAVLLIAFLLQFFLAATGSFVDLFFAALITFAFLFTFWELAVLVLLAIFIVNWEPGVSVEIIIFALYPFVVFFGKGFIHLQSWFKNLVFIFAGFLALYAIFAGRSFIYHPEVFWIDLWGGFVFGSAVFFLLRREGN